MRLFIDRFFALWCYHSFMLDKSQNGSAILLALHAQLWAKRRAYAPVIRQQRGPSEIATTSG
jgi:hypothetical protein